jgi:hypothetical protein
MTIQDCPTRKHRRRRRRHGADTVLAPGPRSVRTPSGQDANASNPQSERIAYANDGVWDERRVRLRDEILAQDDTDLATRGVQLLAQAFSASQSFDRAGGRVAVGGDWSSGDERTTDEAQLAASAGLVIGKRTETTQRAGQAINEKDREQRRLLSKRSPEEVSAAQAWSDANPLRWRGKRSQYNPREVTTWTTAFGVAFVPVNPSAAKTMRAMARAELSGPMPHLLLFAATLEVRHWLRVQPFLVACGHPKWACEHVALEFYGLDRAHAEAAKVAGVRAQAWLAEVNRTRARVDDWLDRAAPRIAENLAERGSLVGGDVYMVDGDLRLLDGGEPPRAARDPATYNCDEPSGMMAEDWWRPERIGLDRFGRRTGSDGGPGAGLREWQGGAAEAHCRAMPAHERIHLGDLDMEERPREPEARRVSEVCELLQRPTLDASAGW